MSKKDSQKQEKKVRIINPILWCIIVIIWIITIVSDLIGNIATWIVIMHAVVALLCLITAIVYIVKYAQGKGKNDDR